MDRVGKLPGAQAVLFIRLLKQKFFSRRGGRPLGVTVQSREKKIDTDKREDGHDKSHN